jgi:hypothetical protein
LPQEVKTDPVVVLDAQVVDPSVDMGSDSEATFGGGMLSATFTGGNLAKLRILSSCMALAFSSEKPGLRSPTTLDENDDMSRVA